MDAASLIQYTILVETIPKEFQIGAEIEELLNADLPRPTVTQDELNVLEKYIRERKNSEVVIPPQSSQPLPIEIPTVQNPPYIPVNPYVQPPIQQPVVQAPNQQFYESKVTELDNKIQASGAKLDRGVLRNLLEQVNWNVQDAYNILIQ